MQRASIVIPTYNGLNLLKKMFTHNTHLLNNKLFEIIVIDNSSSDQTETWIHKHCFNIRYIKLKNNSGFTKACNVGALMAKNEYILFLNNDCNISWVNLLRLIDFIYENPNIVATQPIILDKNREINSIGYVVNLKKAKAKVISDPKYHFLSNLDFKSGQFYGLSATCLLIKRSVFLKIGKFDEKFHSYLEDIDLFMRLAKAHYQYIPCINSYCIHQHMATSKRMGNYKQRQDFKNWIKIIKKNYPPAYILKYFPGLLIERLRNVNGILKTYY